MNQPTPAGTVSVITVGTDVQYVIAGDWLGPHVDAWDNVIAVLRNHFKGASLIDDRPLPEVPDEDLLVTLNESTPANQQIRVDVVPFFDQSRHGARSN